MMKKQEKNSSREELLCQLIQEAAKLTDEEVEYVLKWAEKTFEVTEKVEVK